MSVCPSVTFVNSVKMNKHSPIPSKNFSPSDSQTVLVFPYSKRHSNIPTATPLTGASNAGGVGTNRDSGRIYGYRSMTAAWTNTLKRREQNLIVRCGKSEAKVTDDKRRRSMYRTAEANC